MISSILAFLLAFFFLAKLVLYLFFPARLAALSKPFITCVKNNYLNAQIVGLAILILIAGVVINVIGFIPMIVAGWFWSTIYGLAMIPAYHHLGSLAPIMKMIGSKDFKRDMQVLAGVYVALSILTILVVLGLL